MSSKGKVSAAITYLFSIIVIIYSAAFLLLFVWTDYSLSILYDLQNNTEALIIAGLIIALVLLIALRTLWVGVSEPKTKNQQQSSLIKSGEIGEVYMSFEAINNLIIKASYNIKGVREVKPKIKVMAEGISIQLNIIVGHDVNIPQITLDLQNKVSEYLQEYGGINVIEVKVYVEKVQSQNKTARVE